VNAIPEAAPPLSRAGRDQAALDAHFETAGWHVLELKYGAEAARGVFAAGRRASTRADRRDAERAVPKPVRRGRGEHPPALLSELPGDERSRLEVLLDDYGGQRRPLVDQLAVDPVKSGATSSLPALDELVHLLVSLLIGEQLVQLAPERPDARAMRKRPFEVGLAPLHPLLGLLEVLAGDGRILPQLASRLPTRAMSSRLRQSAV